MRLPPLTRRNWILKIGSHDGAQTRSTTMEGCVHYFFIIVKNLSALFLLLRCDSHVTCLKRFYVIFPAFRWLSRADSMYVYH